MSKNNTNRPDNSSQPSKADKVWKKGKSPSTGAGKSEKKLDDCNNPIVRGEYGKTSKHGWEIDHKKPLAKGGSDNIKNLRPLHWKANREKGDT